MEGEESGVDAFTMKNISQIMSAYFRVWKCLATMQFGSYAQEQIFPFTVHA